MSARTRRWHLGFAVATALALAACSNKSSAVDPHGPEADKVATLWWVMFGLAVAVYVVVATLILRAATRGRKRGVGLRTRLSDDGFVWIGGIVVPALILTLLGVLTVTTSRAIRQPSHRPLVIDVQGRQWWWDVTYPHDGVRTANEIHVPVGQPVRVRLMSDDVVHSFWVPELAGKVDTIPGQVNVLEMRADRQGTYLGVCAEYCGLQHAHMGFAVIAESPGEFERWLTRNRQPAPPPESELAARGQQIFLRNACAGCHTIRGTSAQGRRGPDLTHVASRTTLGARAIENTEHLMLRWIIDPSDFKAGVIMPGHLISREEALAVVAYLRSHD